MANKLKKIPEKVILDLHPPMKELLEIASEIQIYTFLPDYELPNEQEE